MNDRVTRMAGAAAIVFVVLIVITVFSSGAPPAADDSAEKIRTFLVDHRSAILFSVLLQLLAIPFAIWFGAVLRELVRGDRTSDALGVASLGGLLVTAPVALAGAAVLAAAVYVDGVAEQLGDDTMRILFEGQNLLFASTSAGLVVFTVAGALAILRTGALPAYTAWVGLLGGLLNVVALFSVLGAGVAVLGLLGLIGFLLFLLVSGISMAVGQATADSSERIEAGTPRLAAP